MIGYLTKGINGNYSTISSLDSSLDNVGDHLRSVRFYGSCQLENAQEPSYFQNNDAQQRGDSLSHL